MHKKSKKFDAVKALKGDKPGPRAIKRSDGTSLSQAKDNSDALQERVMRQLTGELKQTEQKSSPIEHVKVRRLDSPVSRIKKNEPISLREAVERTLLEDPEGLTDDHEAFLLDDDPCEYDSWTEEI